MSNNKIACYVLTQSGLELAQSIATKIEINIFTSKRLDSSKYIVFDSLKDCITEHFFKFKAHIFITAAGIAVRCIAAHIGHKSNDPAVIVCDQQGKFVISLLSGHWGGANYLAKHLAQIIGAIPIITTATDVENLPSIDMLALHYNCAILDWDKVKEINMAILNKQKIQLIAPINLINELDGIKPFKGIEITEYIEALETIKSIEATAAVECIKPIEALETIKYNKGIEATDPIEEIETLASVEQIKPIEALAPNSIINICKNYFTPITNAQLDLEQPAVSIHWGKIKKQPKLLRICPAVLHVGIGFRLHVSSAEIQKALEHVFEVLNLEIKSIARLASASIKENEPTLYTLAQKLECALVFFTPDELSKIPIASPSSKAAEIFDVPQISVCEGAALLSAGNSSILISKKIKHQGIITLAIAANKNILIS